MRRCSASIAYETNLAKLIMDYCAYGTSIRVARNLRAQGRIKLLELHQGYRSLLCILEITDLGVASKLWA